MINEEDIINDQSGVMPDAVLIDAVVKFWHQRKVKSFSQRNPELGKMIKCQVCQHRHRSSQTCLPKYALEATGPGRPQKKRYHPHPNKRALLLIERTREIFPKYANRPGMDEVDAMKCARAQAGRELRAERKAKRK